jgi:hypothetical protein
MSNIKIELVTKGELHVPEWKSTYTLRPELLVISSSLMQHGFIQPLHARRETKEIIDGSERYNLFMEIDEISENHGELIPVIFHDCDKMEAMMMHMQLNRGKSVIVAAKMSKIIREMKRSGRYTNQDFDDLLCMKSDELSLMLDSSLLKVRKIKEHNYARAWVPIEAPSGKEEISRSFFESPPNPDR